MAERDASEAQRAASSGAADTGRAPRPLPPGTRVEVRSAYDGSWTRGFEVLESEPGGYRLVRCAEQTQLPGLIRSEDVRRERRRDGWWW